MFGLKYESYLPVGDIITIVICIINALLLYSTYTVRKKNLVLFHCANSLTGVAACFSIIFHEIQRGGGRCSKWVVYLSGDIMYLALMFTFAIFCMYLFNLTRSDQKSTRSMYTIVLSLYALFVVLEMTGLCTGFGFKVNDDLSVTQDYFCNPFVYGYVVYSIIVLLIMILYRRKFITKVRICIMQVMTLTFLLILVQVHFRQSSFTCISFVLPITSALFLFHYNAYDTETGTLDAKSFLGYLTDLQEEKFTIICMDLKDMTQLKMDELAEHFFHFNEQFFKDCCTFRINEERMCMIIRDRKNPNIKQRLVPLLEEFNVLYAKYQIDYKLILIKSDKRIETGADYLGLMDLIESKMEWVSYKECDETSIKKYLRLKVVESALKDIVSKEDLNDDRVKVYCQPVLNTKTGEFSTAEALMRMVIPEHGMIFPDEFIPVAEQYNYIHTLSKIILYKSCVAILKLETEGYRLERMSINFSMIEMRGKNFCQDILDIIKETKVNPTKVAIELTESRSERDFELVKRIMKNLHEVGIKFYLDDFGTGYSNFERIIGLPIDIIKFDRSLTIMAGKDEQSRYIVGRFSDIFHNSNYQVLFEGIEDNEDEQRCMAMNAMYLQGYKYSKPIPIEELYKFLKKN